MIPLPTKRRVGERALLGHRDPFFIHLAQLAAIAPTTVGVLSVGSYIVLYRRFDRVMLRSLAVSRERRRSWRPALTAWIPGEITVSPARAAVRDFTVATLRRSALHHGVILQLR